MAIALAVFDVAGTTVLDDDAVVDAMIAALALDEVCVPRGAVKAAMGMPKPMAIGVPLIDRLQELLPLVRAI